MKNPVRKPTQIRKEVSPLTISFGHSFCAVALWIALINAGLADSSNFDVQPSKALQGESLMLLPCRGLEPPHIEKCN